MPSCFRRRVPTRDNGMSHSWAMWESGVLPRSLVHGSASPEGALGGNPQRSAVTADNGNVEVTGSDTTGGFQTSTANVRSGRLYDTNYWKTFVHARLAVPMGDPGRLSLFGRNPETHRLFAEHLLAEYRMKTEGRGRTVDEWKLRPEASDNHWLDGLVGCAVGASMQGAVLPGTDGGKPEKRKERVKLSDLQRSRR